MNIFYHISIVMLVVIFSLRHRVVCNEVDKVKIWCTSLEHQKAVNVSSLVGPWHGTQLVTHSGSDLEGVYDYGKCIRIFIEKDLQWNWFRELEACQLSWHVRMFYQSQGPQLRRLLLHWHEGTHSTQYTASYLRHQNGIWNYSKPEHKDHRNEPCTNLPEPLGKMTVILANSELLVLTVCQREPPALYTVVLGRPGAPRPNRRGHLPRHINRLLRRHGLSTARSEYLCDGAEPDSLGMMALMGSLVVVMVGRVVMG